MVLPTRAISTGQVDIRQLLEEVDSFAAIVLEGVLLERLGIAEHIALRLLGPGDLISLRRQPRPLVLSDADCRVLTKAKIALLGPEVLAGAQRWPQLLAGLHVRAAEQYERVVTQLAICQLPRVDQRLMAMMWLLAEAWGRVTTSGTSLPMNLTHDVLGGLVGARRSTVTLALGELAERGSLIRQDGGWLLLEPPPSYANRLPEFEDIQLVGEQPSGWYADAGGQVAPVNHQHLLERVARLREEHGRRREQMRAQRERFAASRARQEERRRTRNEELTAPTVPS